MVRRDSSAIKLDTVQIAFILALVYWWSTWKKPWWWAYCCSHCYYYHYMDYLLGLCLTYYRSRVQIQNHWSQDSWLFICTIICFSLQKMSNLIVRLYNYLFQFAKKSDLIVHLYNYLFQFAKKGLIWLFICTIICFSLQNKSDLIVQLFNYLLHFAKKIWFDCSFVQLFASVCKKSLIWLFICTIIYFSLKKQSDLIVHLYSYLLQFAKKSDLIVHLYNYLLQFA